MSESMAFIGGVAVAGLAALLLLKGTGNALQPNFAVTPQMPTVVAPQAVMQPGYPTYGQAGYPNQPAPAGPSAEERVAMERLKMENEALKKENDQIKIQYQQLQFQFQSQVNAFNAQNNQTPVRQATLPPEQGHWWSSPMAWAVGGMTLTIGGGIVVAGVLALFSPKQRPTRTVQVIHPYTGATPPLAPVRRTEFLPPRNEVRRVEAPEYDDTY
ncbi:MAG: heterocyst differentiation related protein [Stigonema ocellatum SAG 48.90 = DSM 106950]|nr:heterocyst differentiation related protein [Stigonema ocellatum SAG 48.90 = DSM 106950]